MAGKDYTDNPYYMVVLPTPGLYIQGAVAIAWLGQHAKFLS